MGGFEPFVSSKPGSTTPRSCVERRSEATAAPQGRGPQTRVTETTKNALRFAIGCECVWTNFSRVPQRNASCNSTGCFGSKATGHVFRGARRPVPRVRRRHFARGAPVGRAEGGWNGFGAFGHLQANGQRAAFDMYQYYMKSGSILLSEE